jgi:hypothetical protein
MPTRSTPPAHITGHTAPAPQEPASEPTQATSHTSPVATERQRNYITSLRDSRELTDSQRAWVDGILDHPAGIDRTFASKVIDKLVALPHKQTSFASKVTDKKFVSTLPAGHYALREDGDELNTVRFYRVTIGKNGKWQGFRFVDRYAGDDTFPVMGIERIRVLEAIESKPLEAAQLYGREENRCCICNRNLTRRLSRELGIGPVCGAKHGWLTDAMIEQAKDDLTTQGFDPQETI